MGTAHVKTTDAHLAPSAYDGLNTNKAHFGAVCLAATRMPIDASISLIKTLKMNNIESKMQCACVRWFRLAHHKIASLLFAVPNGGARSAITGAILKAEGVTKGVADLLLLVPNASYHGLCIEMKTKQGHQSPSQKEWQSAVEAQGYKYVVIRSLDQFMGEVTKYLSEL